MRNHRDGYGVRRTLMQLALTCAALLCVFAVNSRVGEALGPPQALPTAAAEKEERRLPILMYHSILRDAGRQGRYVLSPEALAQDLDYLQAAGFETVTVADLLAFADGTGTLPEKPVLLTFDDGFCNNRLYAAPLLRERGMRAVLSPIGEEAARADEGQENPYWAYLSPNRLRELAEEGVFEVQNHSYALHELGRRRGCLRVRGEDPAAYRRLLEEDTARAEALLTGAGLPAPTCYTYPFGAWAPETEDILRGLGYRCTLTCEERPNRIRRGEPEDLFRLGRYNRPAGVSTERFLARALGEAKP